MSVITSKEEARIGALAYDAYCKEVDYVSYTGGSLPPFENLPERIQFAWYAAAKAARNDFRERLEFGRTTV